MLKLILICTVLASASVASPNVEKRVVNYAIEALRSVLTTLSSFIERVAGKLKDHVHRIRDRIEYCLRRISEFVEGVVEDPSKVIKELLDAVTDIKNMLREGRSSGELNFFEKIELDAIILALTTAQGALSVIAY